MRAIDTSVVVRYVTADHPEQSPRARALVDGYGVFVSHTVMLESEWVLRSVYGFGRAAVCRALREFSGLPTVTAQEPAVLAAALGLAERGMDFADALHLEAARHCEAFFTFDRKLIARAGEDGTIPAREV